MNWKRAFWMLAAVNAAVIVLAALKPSPPVKRPAHPDVEGASFTVYSKKAHLNAVINDYLVKKTKGHSLQYRVWLADRVYVSSEIPILGRPVELVVSFVPKVVKGGNVELTEPTISFGDWKLPVTYVLRYLQKHAPLPDEVAIDPEHTRVYVALTDIRFGNSYQVAAKKIDLAADEIVFTLTIPTKQHQ
ncbi:YpmS family protein [Geobacillus proteiniphilus]|uniref:YpmS family protein n=1 Tax=Geobacillus proteiniphilus TaxID=860353 RepID=A0ABY9MCH8_9BACL|nr:YpmS family protein [Geobacillus proteiniphilus]WMJ15461.1 YpmS family protein [Geobacillus proteiniphilus]